MEEGARTPTVTRMREKRKGGLRRLLEGQRHLWGGVRGKLTVWGSLGEGWSLGYQAIVPPMVGVGPARGPRGLVLSQPCRQLSLYPGACGEDPGSHLNQEGEGGRQPSLPRPHQTAGVKVPQACRPTVPSRQ